MSELKPCPMCLARGKTWEGSDPKCAFMNGVFDKDNWNCATMNALRDRCVEHYSWTDQHCGIIVVPEAIEFYALFIYLGWYKNRGCTEQALMMYDNSNEPLSLAVAEAIINTVPPVEPTKG